MLIHGILLGIILQIMVFDYVNSNLMQSDKFAWILALLGFTMVVGALVMTAQIKATTERMPSALATFAGVCAIALAIAVVYIVLHLNRLSQRPANVVESIGFVADVITWFYIYFFGLLLALALVLLLNGPLPPSLFREPFYLVVYGAIAAAVVFGISTTNLNSIRADIFYKQGLNFDGQRQFDGSLCMYEEAIRLAPDQDFYYLFYGRAFLEKAKSVPETTQAQPLYNCYPNNAAMAFKDPPGVARTGSQRTRLMESARYFLVRARDLNPLNTDHTANLARMYRTWAEITPDGAQRTDYLTKAVSFYGQAQLLSPHNAQILNEYGSAIAMLGQTDSALAKLQESLAIDNEYAQTYLLLGDLHANKEDFDNAVRAYQQALELDPGLLQAHSALGMLYSRQGKVDLAIQENLTIVSQQPNDYNSLRNLALLYRDAGRISEAIVYAQRALAVAPEQDKAPLQQLISQLQASIGTSGAPTVVPTPAPTPNR